MSSPSFDANTWYSIQSFGSDFFIAAGNISGNFGNITTDTNDLKDNTYWQIGSTNGSKYLRSKQAGSSYCLVTSGDSLRIEQCTSSSPAWNIANVNGRDAGDGYAITNGATGNDKRLFINYSNYAISMQQYPPSSNNGGDIYYQWGIRSRAAINDQAWSLFPAGSSTSSSNISSSTSSATSSSTTPTSVSATTTSGSSGGGTGGGSGSTTTTPSGPEEPSTSTHLVTETLSSSSSLSTTVVTGGDGGLSTVVTTVPASSSSVVSPTPGLNGAAQVTGIKPLMLVLSLGVGALLGGFM